MDIQQGVLNNISRVISSEFEKLRATILATAGVPSVSESENSEKSEDTEEWEDAKESDNEEESEGSEKSEDEEESEDVDVSEDAQDEESEDNLYQENDSSLEQATDDFVEPPAHDSEVYDHEVLYSFSVENDLDISLAQSFEYLMFDQNLVQEQNDLSLVDETSGENLSCQCSTNQHGSLEQILDFELSAYTIGRLTDFYEGPIQNLRDELDKYGEPIPGGPPCKLLYLQCLRRIMVETELAMAGLVEHDQVLFSSLPENSDVPEIPEPQVVNNPNADCPNPLGWCVICYGKPRECAFVPCGHVTCCEDCAKSGQLNCCPTCRGEIENVQFLYVA